MAFGYEFSMCMYLLSALIVHGTMLTTHFGKRDQTMQNGDRT